MLPESVAREAARPTSLVSKILQHATAETSSGPVVFSPLCQPCERIFHGAIPSKELGNAAQYPLGQTVSQLKASAQQTCHLCRVRWSQLSCVDVERLSQEQDIKYGYWESGQDHGIAFNYPAARPEDRSITKSVALVPAEGLGGTIKSLLIRKAELTLSTSVSELSVRSSSSMNSPSSMISILTWIESCKTHEKCRMSNSQNRSLPTRVVDVGQGNTIKPVLRLTSQLPVSTLYVALSHCWGDTKYLELLSTNIEALQQSIDVSQLSKTFRDAMEVTWRCGLCYIWIDSLCIMQDSDNDWAQEASRMADIYSYSYFTIAATAAKDGSYGLLRQRDWLDVEPCLVDVQWSGYRQSAYYCYGIGEWDWELENQPLVSRAWAVQERMLSPRIVHFGRRKLFWECQERLACESYPDKVPNFYASKPSIYPEPITNPLLRMFRGDDDYDNFPYHEIWKEAVQKYSQAELTYKTNDKLVAIAGIASRLEIPATDYLAGLWRPGLAEQLLWSVKGNGNGSKTPAHSTEYRAPSWSWASLDCGVHMSMPKVESTRDICVEILEASTKLVNPNNPYGQVSDATLRLRCMLAMAPVSRRFVCRNSDTVFKERKLVEVPLPSDSASIISPSLFLGDDHVTMSIDEFDNIILGQPYIFLPVSRQPDGRGRGLVIALTGRKPGEYRRIGTFEVLLTLSANPGLHITALCRAFAGTVSDTQFYDCEAGDEDDGIRRYIITLV